MESSERGSNLQRSNKTNCSFEDCSPNQRISKTETKRDQLSVWLHLEAQCDFQIYLNHAKVCRLWVQALPAVAPWTLLIVCSSASLDYSNNCNFLQLKKLLCQNISVGFFQWLSGSDIAAEHDTRCCWQQCELVLQGQAPCDRNAFAS